MEKNDNNNSEVQNQVRIVDIPITDENSALNVMINFLSIAQKRGAFTINESAKLWECIKIFQKLE
jgi:hypothetical protein